MMVRFLKIAELIRPNVETAANIGKQIVIDIETGEYDMYVDGQAPACQPP